jgi:serine/threonine protein kinase
MNLRDLLPSVLIDDQGLDLLLKMLEYEPSRRISARHALQHPYFANVQLPNDLWRKTWYNKKIVRMNEKANLQLKLTSSSLKAIQGEMKKLDSNLQIK